MIPAAPMPATARPRINIAEVAATVQSRNPFEDADADDVQHLHGCQTVQLAEEEGKTQPS